MKFVLPFICTLVATLSFGAREVFEINGTGSLRECAYSCSRECRALVRSSQQMINEHFQNCDGNAPGPGPNPYPRPRTSRVEIYSSDSCTTGLVAYADHRTYCGDLTGNAWGVKIEGTCYNIEDTSARSACEKFKGADPVNDVAIYNSDSCNTGLVAFVNDYSDCSQVSGNAWGVKMDGRCHNIDDTSAATACRRFKRGDDLRNATFIYSTDSCRSGLLAIVNRSTNCNDIGNGNAWGIKRADGECVNIEDMSLQQACSRFGGGR